MNDVRRKPEVDLLLEVCRCSILEDTLRDPAYASDCKPLIESQAATSRTFQVPEPWSGHLTEAKILFIGSNPSIDPAEVFPTRDSSVWDNTAVADFFLNRFSHGRQVWVDERLRVLKTDGSRGHWVRTWAGCRRRADELLKIRDSKPGTDFALTEAVHCKSKREGVDGKNVARLAAKACASKYLERIVKLSKAVVILPMGDIAVDTCRDIFRLSGDSRFYGPLIIGDLSRYFVFIDHPTGRGKKKKVAAALTLAQLEEVQSALKRIA